MFPFSGSETGENLHIAQCTPGVGPRAWAAAPGGGGDGGTGPPQTFQRLTLCLWAVHGKNQLQIVLVPPQSSRRGAALGLGGRRDATPSGFLIKNYERLSRLPRSLDA